MKRLLIALALALIVLPTAAWSMGDPNTNFDMNYTNGVAYGWTAYTMGWAPSTPVYYAQIAGMQGSAQQVTSAGEGGVYGQFDTMAGFDYTISVWMNSSWAGSGNFAVDWNGGTDPNAIPWDGWKFNSADNTWQELTWTGTAAGDKVTVFLDAYAGTAQFDNLTGVDGSVPEPSSVLALCTGLIGLVGIIRRRK